MKKQIAEMIKVNETVQVLFIDDTTRTYKIQYTNAGRTCLRVYGKRIYDI